MGRGLGRVIVIDSSAIVAILWNEPQADALAERIAAEPAGARRMSVASYLEVGAVLAGRRVRERLQAIADLDAFLADLGVTLEPIDEAQGRVALRARIEHRRGMGHGGPLNFGDCFSYALAKALDAPLLFIGEDFSATDIAVAL
jgi:ribonuclease VapC